MAVVAPQGTGWEVTAGWGWLNIPWLGFGGGSLCDGSAMGWETWGPGTTVGITGLDQPPISITVTAVSPQLSQPQCRGAPRGEGTPLVRSKKPPLSLGLGTLLYIYIYIYLYIYKYRDFS